MELTPEDMIVLEILEPALRFVPKCPVDSKVIDDTFPTLKCPVCGTPICMFPCVENLASRKKKCPACKKFEMSRLTEIVRNAKFRTNLEELKAKGGVSDSVYEKLKLEYESRNRDAIHRIYATSQERDGG
jgi:hypothetical protein